MLVVILLLSYENSKKAKAWYIPESIKKKNQLEIAHAFVPELAQMLACSVVLLGSSASLCGVLCEQLTWYQLSSVNPAALSLMLTVKGSFVTSEPRLQEGGLPGCGQAYLCTSKGKRLWVTKKKKKKWNPVKQAFFFLSVVANVFCLLAANRCQS